MSTGDAERPPWWGPWSSQLAVTPCDQKRARLAQPGKATQAPRQGDVALLRRFTEPWPGAVCCGAALCGAGRDAVAVPAGPKEVVSATPPGGLQGARPLHCPSVRHGEAAGAELGCSSGCWVSASGPSSHHDASKSGALPSCGRRRPGLLSSETLTFSAAELFGRLVWGKLILSNFSV